MYVQTEGIVLRQVKTVNSRRMIVIFTKNYGKLSCGTNISEGGKNKTALALRPFTYGNYELFKSRDSFSLQSAEAIKSYYSLGEDIDKYMIASNALELTDKVLLEGETQKSLFDLLVEFLSLIEKRKKAFDTLFIAYEIKLLKIQGLCVSEGLKERLSDELFEVIKFVETRRISELENLALNIEVEEQLKLLLKEYFSFHLGIDKLKSEEINF